MIRMSLATLALLAVQAVPSSALVVTPGDTIRGAYSYPTLGTTGLDPASFFLRLSATDPFGGVDSVGIRYLDAALNPLSFTQFDAGGSGLDQTVGITFESSDYLAASSGSAHPPGVPSSGFVEIIGLAGSFDVTELGLFATEPVGAGIFRRARVAEFAYVDTPTPSEVPLPASALLLLSGVLAAFGFRFGHAVHESPRMYE